MPVKNPGAGHVYISPFQPGDERLIPDLVKSVYGDAYDPRFRDPAAILEMVHGGLFLMVAREGDRALGMSGFFAGDAPNARLFRSGRRMVLPEARKGGIASACEAWGQERFFSAQLGDALYANVPAPGPAGARLRKKGNVLSALEPALPNRPARLLAFRLFAQEKRTVWLPVDYGPEIAMITASLHPSWVCQPAFGSCPAGAVTEGTVRDEEELLRLSMTRAGADFAACLDRWEQKGKPVEVFLSLDVEWHNEAVAELRRRGYYFCGLAPLWNGPRSDALIMTKTAGAPDLAGVDFPEELGRYLIFMIRRDSARARAVCGAIQ